MTARSRPLKRSASIIYSVKIVKMTEPMQTIIFLVRHGQTDRFYSTDPRLDGQRVLTEQGRAQMKKVGEYLADFAPVKVYTSPTMRTTQCAEIICETAGVMHPYEERQELIEVYSNADYTSITTRIPHLFNELIKKHTGQHIICLSHQDVIQRGLDCYELTSTEKDLPCQMGEMYRLTFAGEKLVECHKLRPAHEVQS